MAIVYEQVPPVLIKGLFQPCSLFMSVSVFYYGKNIGYKPGVLTRLVLSCQASFFSLVSTGTERKYCRDNHKYDAYIEISKHRITHGVLYAMA